MMPYLVFDIETAALPFDDYDPARQEYLLRGCTTPEEIERQKSMLSLNGLTAQVVCIGMVYIESLDAEPKGYVYSTVPGAEDSEEKTLSDGSLWRRMEETSLLERWWEIVGRRPVHLISFNGRGFDCPFLMLRSAMLGIRPTRNLMDGTRYRYDRHTDLQDELAFYNYSSGIGPMKRFNMDFYCKTFGITSPKEAGVTGDQVPALFAAGEHETIAAYCLRDVFSTWQLYRHWKNYLDV